MPEFIASDLVAQAEHDPDALVLLITQSRKLAASVSRSVAVLARGKFDRAASTAETWRRAAGIFAAAGHRLDELHRARTPHHHAQESARHCQRGFYFSWGLLGPSGGGLRLRTESRAADRRAPPASVADSASSTSSKSLRCRNSRAQVCGRLRHPLLHWPKLKDFKHTLSRYN